MRVLIGWSGNMGTYQEIFLDQEVMNSFVELFSRNILQKQLGELEDFSTYVQTFD